MSVESIQEFDFDDEAIGALHDRFVKRLGIQNYIYRLNKKKATQDDEIKVQRLDEAISDLREYRGNLKEKIRDWAALELQNLKNGAITSELPANAAFKRCSQLIVVHLKADWKIWRENHPIVGKCIGSYCK